MRKKTNTNVFNFRFLRDYGRSSQLEFNKTKKKLLIMRWNKAGESWMKFLGEDGPKEIEKFYKEQKKKEIVKILLKLKEKGKIRGIPSNLGFKINQF